MLMLQLYINKVILYNIRHSEHHYSNNLCGIIRSDLQSSLANLCLTKIINVTLQKYINDHVSHAKRFCVLQVMTQREL
jgi:ABC-type tungstate transport system substrate-binding protein